MRYGKENIITEVTTGMGVNSGGGGERLNPPNYQQIHRSGPPKMGEDLNLPLYVHPVLHSWPQALIFMQQIYTRYTINFIPLFMLFHGQEPRYFLNKIFVMLHVIYKKYCCGDNKTHTSVPRTKVELAWNQAHSFNKDAEKMFLWSFNFSFAGSFML